MGASIHLLDADISTGSVIVQSLPEPDISNTYYSYSAKLIMETTNLYVNIIDRLAKKVNLKHYRRPGPF